MNAQGEAFKAQARAAWDQSAEGWDRHAPEIRAWLGEATQAMLEMAGIGPGQRVLDVAAGAGGQTLDIARRVGPSGHVLATDLSPAILALAQTNAMRAGLSQVSTKVADGEALDVEPASFDATVSRLGLMLFPDPDLPGLSETLIPREDGSIPRGAHEKESIHGRADGVDPARSRPHHGGRGSQEAQSQ